MWMVSVDSWKYRLCIAMEDVECMVNPPKLSLVSICSLLHLIISIYRDLLQPLYLISPLWLCCTCCNIVWYTIKVLMELYRIFACQIKCSTPGLFEYSNQSHQVNTTIAVTKIWLQHSLWFPRQLTFIWLTYDGDTDWLTQGIENHTPCRLAAKDRWCWYSLWMSSKGQARVDQGQNQ